MMQITKILNNLGYLLLENIYSTEEVGHILKKIQEKKESNTNFRKQADLFAIRSFLKEFPDLKPLLFNQNFKKLVQQFGQDYKIVKAIYFDKPPRANWIVNWHQDLTISVDKKQEIEGFKHWTKKRDGFAVQPPLNYLENIITIRIHLDDCTAANGALRVIPRSHQHACIRPNMFPDFIKKEMICESSKGGVLIMKPLILHASKRSENQAHRRVIHLELSNLELSKNLEWRELEQII